MKQISLQVDDASRLILEKLVHFCKKHISSKVLQLLEEINEGLINKFCRYLLNSYPRLILEADQKSLNLGMLALLDSKIADKLLKRVTWLSPQLVLKDSVAKLVELRSNKEKTNEFEKDKEMLTLAILEVLTGQLSKSVLHENRLAPLLELPLAEIITSRQKDKESSIHRDDRLKERSSNRAFLSLKNKEELRKHIEQKILQMVESSSGNNKADGETNAAETIRVEDNFTNRRLLGWINLDRLFLKTDVSFKKLFISYIQLVFEHMVQLETYDFKIMNEFCPPPKGQVVPSRDISIDDAGMPPEENQYSSCKVLHSEEALDEFFDFAHLAFKQSLISLVAVFIMLDHYSFLASQQTVFAKDLLHAGFSNLDDVSNICGLVMDEIKGLMSDEHRLVFLPDFLILGLFKINLTPFKSCIRQLIDDNKKTLKKVVITEMKSQLDHIEAGMKLVHSVCNAVPGQVDDYISLKKRLESDEFQRKITKLDIYSKAIDALARCMEELRDFDEVHHLILKKLFYNNLLKECFEHHRKFSETFKNSRVDFYDEITLHRVELLNEFQVM